MTLALQDNLIEPSRHQNLAALDRLETFLYLIPIIGLFPSLWAIYRRQRDQRQLAVCRLSIFLALTWLTLYLGLNVGADLAGASTSVSVRLLFANGLITSGYFLTSVWLMMRLWKKKSLRLPGISAASERMIDSK